jgi:hypothetical protein
VNRADPLGVYACAERASLPGLRIMISDKPSAYGDLLGSGTKSRFSPLEIAIPTGKRLRGRRTLAGHGRVTRAPCFSSALIRHPSRASVTERRPM